MADNNQTDNGDEGFKAPVAKMSSGEDVSPAMPRLDWSSLPVVILTGEALARHEEMLIEETGYSSEAIEDGPKPTLG